MTADREPRLVEIPESVTLLVGVVLLALLAGGVAWWTERIWGWLP